MPNIWQSILWRWENCAIIATLIQMLLKTAILVWKIHFLRKVVKNWKLWGECCTHTCWPLLVPFDERKANTNKKFSGFEGREEEPETFGCGINTQKNQSKGVRR